MTQLGAMVEDARERDAGKPVVPQIPVSLAALAGLGLLAVFAWQLGGWRIAAGGLLGGLGGFALYHASFGFTSAWRQFIVEGRGAGVRAQLLLVALIAVFAFPLIGLSSIFGMQIGGFVFPFGIAAAIGAFLFGAGMQLGGGCGSGTLYTVGGGSTRMVITLAAFIAGSVIATPHLDAWHTLPSLPPASIILAAGPVGGLLFGVVIIGMLAWLTAVIEWRRYGELEQDRQITSFIHGPWSRRTGAVMLAVMAIGTLIVLGRPWGITSGFALWGAKIGDAIGWDVASWPYWRYSAALTAPVLADATSVQNFGVMLGALLAAGMAGRFAPLWRIGLGSALAAVIGGLMMGYGARLAFGCNIGALLGGLTSGSLHGVGWLIFGFMGSLVGVRFRRGFGLA